MKATPHWRSNEHLVEALNFGPAPYPREPRTRPAGAPRQPPALKCSTCDAMNLPDRRRGCGRCGASLRSATPVPGVEVADDQPRAARAPAMSAVEAVLAAADEMSPRFADADPQTQADLRIAARKLVEAAAEADARASDRRRHARHWRETCPELARGLLGA